jgi:hypothetical protein
MPNNLNPVPTLINLSPQQLIVVTVNIFPTIDALTFVDPVGEFFQVHKLEFFEFFCSSPLSVGKKMKPSRCST